MLVPFILMFSPLAGQETPPVPGMCSAPADQNVERAGCYLSTELDVSGAPESLFWQIYEFTDRREAAREAARHRWATTVVAHQRTWLYVLSEHGEPIRGGAKKASIGPLRKPSGTVHARFMEANFPPGMRTRVHSHGGPEAFYVVEGEQCMDSPSDRQKLMAGSTYIINGGPHVQTAPHGRRNLVLVLAPTNQPWSVVRTDWTPSHFCDR